MLLGLTAALLAAVVFGLVAVVQAAVIRRRGLLSPVMLAVVTAYGVGWLLHLVAIAHLPLYLAQVGVGASLVFTALAAAFVMGEPLRPEHWAAVVTMVIGLACLAIASGHVGDAVATSRTTLALFGGLLGCAVLGGILWRSRGRLSGVALAALAGTAYTGTPMGTRLLVHFTWTTHVLLAAVAVPLYGALGFLLYSAAMRRTSVTAASALVVLLQTALPAALGLLAYGDGVRAGWWPVAVMAFVASVAASLVLCGAEARLDDLEALEVE